MTNLAFQFLALRCMEVMPISRLHCYSNAQVVKLVNTRLKSLDLGLAGSSPALGTILFLTHNNPVMSVQVFLNLKMMKSVSL